MRNFLMIFVTVASLGSVASARTIKPVHVTRVAAGEYRVESDDGSKQTIKAHGCTDSATDKPAILDDNGAFAELHFLDDSGEVEDTCNVKVPKVATVKVKAPRTVASK